VEWRALAENFSRMIAALIAKSGALTFESATINATVLSSFSAVDTLRLREFLRGSAPDVKFGGKCGHRFFDMTVTAT